MADDDDFFIDPTQLEPSELSQYQGTKFTKDWAPIIQLIQLRIQDTPIDEDTKKYLLKYIVPYINLAGFTSIDKPQIIEFYIGWNRLWSKYRVYMNPSRDPELIFLRSWIEEVLFMMLNKSVDALQLREVFETKATYNVKHQQPFHEKVGAIFGRGKKKKTITEEEE